MRALNVPAPGEQPRLSDVAVPEVTEGTVLVRVHAAALNPIDVAIAAGMLAGMMPHEYPVVIGRDAAGVVEAVGTGVEHVRPGDEVLGHVLLVPPVQAGTLAEYALLPAAAVVRKPAGLDFVTAAAIPLAGAAAVATVDLVDPQPGQTVLVNGATGGVGAFAIQLLAARGARVVATGTPQDTARLRSLGADEVVDFTAGPVGKQVLTNHPEGVDALVNLYGMSLVDVPLDAVRSGGKVATLTPAPDAEALAAAGLSGGSVMASAVREVTAPLADMAAAGSLRVDVGSVLTLEQAADGLAALAAGQGRGKTVVTVRS